LGLGDFRVGDELRLLAGLLCLRALDHRIAIRLSLGDLREIGRAHV